jgi:hypothetical protein
MDLKDTPVYILQNQTNKMTTITNANNSCEAGLAIAKAFQQKKSNHDLIEEYRVFAASKGKVWSELTEDEVVALIIENETAKEIAVQCKFPCGGDPDCKKKTCGCAQAERFRFVQECERQDLEACMDADTDDDLPVLAQEQHMQQQWFNLMVGDAKQVLDHICNLTDRFSVLDPEFTYWLVEKIGQRPFTTFGYLPAPANVDLTKQIIGKDGYYFKLTTINTGVDFIWHDRKENHFLFWGPKVCVVQAMKIIQSRIRKGGPRFPLDPSLKGNQGSP